MKTMKRLGLMASLLAVCALSLAQSNKPMKVELWPDGLPNSNGIEHEGYSDSKFNYKPSIEVFLPSNAQKPVRTVLICPGGGYYLLSLQNEGTDWANFFLNQGMAVAVLRYRMPHENDQVPQSDAYQAIRILKQHAQEWNINPNDIGIMGFSAGGHLASTVATHAPADVLPAFQILVYPVITMDLAFTHKGSHDLLLGKTPSEEKLRLYCNELQVSDNTPRAFLVLADDDTVVPPLNSIRYYEALKAHNIPATMHIYPSGGHGFGISTGFRYHADMLLNIESWLKTF